jgi:hypothetical protein
MADMAAVASDLSHGQAAGEVGRPLEPWLRMCRAKWWKSVRPLAIGCATVAFLLIAYQCVHTWCSWVTDGYRPNYLEFRGFGWEQRFLDSNYQWLFGRYLYYVPMGLNFLKAITCQYIVLSLIPGHRLPLEVALSQPEPRLYHAVLRSIRIYGYKVVLLLMFSPTLCDVVERIALWHNAEEIVSGVLRLVLAVSLLLFFVEMACTLARRPDWPVLHLYGSFFLIMLVTYTAAMLYGRSLLHLSSQLSVGTHDSGPLWYKLRCGIPQFLQLAVGLALWFLNSRKVPAMFTARIASYGA